MKTAIVMPPGSCFCEVRPNSMETVVRTLAGACAHEGEVKVFCCEGAEVYGDFTVEILPRGRSARLKALRHALEAYEPDLIEFHQQTSQATKIAGSIPGAVSILYRHNALKTSNNPINRWRYKSRYQKLDGLVFVSESERRIFLQDFPELADRAYAIPNPIDAELWRGDVEDRDKVIAFAGRAMQEKGVDLICAALPDILDRHPDWRAVLMLNDWEMHGGWAQPHVAPLERYGERVRVLRSASLGDVRNVMKRAAIALTPSTWSEPLGLTALEAHAAGAALISSGRGGLREASGPHALYVDELTADNLGAAMESLVVDPARRLAMARAAQAFVIETHSPAARAAELNALRCSLLGARRTRRMAA
ncbi:glycosyltransferase family 4 protein [Brevundimonas faecalis]|uniref:glycosyltransferase family 4 protein n=1 Tax=Brevundimonas faecalis TaxID=947378 RepID=UPI003615DCF4